MTDNDLRELLKSSKRIAVVGLSSNPARASLGVSRFLQRHGYEIVPVNPGETEVLGARSYASLSEVPGTIDIVDIFRRPEFVPAIVTEAVERGDVRCIWMQEGIVSQEGATKASEAGIPVVMDRCILKELARLL
jgi:uncharacterized protein